MMEETANPTPSSTFAPEMPTTTREPKATTTSIKLLIKASNQQHDDQIIESDLLWTVFRLKTQLSLVYPSKPPVAEQKLIYSGQLLNDRAQLKDIIRSYKDVYTQNHILHLVYTPKNQPLHPQKSKMAPTTDTDGLRQRHNNANSNSSNNTSNSNNNSMPNTVPQPASQQQMSSPFGFLASGLQQNSFGSSSASYTPNSITTTTTNGNGFDMQTLATQQVAMYNWMWQTYGQYMHQYMQNNAAQMPATANTPFNTAHTINPVIAFPNLQPAAFFSQPYPTQQHQIPTTISTPPTTPVQQAEQPQQPQELEAAAAPAAPAPPQPRFPNLVQEEHENRDWLDSFFSIMRFALFLTILYFNSSPMRCFVVFLIAGGIYLYHIGFFRTRQERNNNDINRINNAAAEPAREAQEAEQQDQPDNAAPEESNLPQTEASSSSTSSSSDLNNAADAQDAVNEDNNSTSVIAFMRSFIVSFFTSLLPETPAAL